MGTSIPASRSAAPSSPEVTPRQSTPSEKAPPAAPGQVDEAPELRFDKHGLAALDARRNDGDAGLDEVLEDTDVVDESPRQGFEIGGPVQGSGPAREAPVLGDDLIEHPRLRRETLQDLPFVAVARADGDVAEPGQNVGLGQGEPVDPLDPARKAPRHGVEPAGAAGGGGGGTRPPAPGRRRADP